MRIATPIKIGLVGVFSCLTLLVSMFSATAIASARSTNMFQSQASASAVVNDREQVRCRTRTIVTRFRGYEDVRNHLFVPNNKISFFHHQRGTFVIVRNRRVFDPVFLTFFERRTIVTTCNGHSTMKTSTKPSSHK